MDIKVEMGTNYNLPPLKFSFFRIIFHSLALLLSDYESAEVYLYMAFGSKCFGTELMYQ